MLSKSVKKARRFSAQRGFLISSTSFAAVFHVIPIFLPFLSPCERQTTGYTDFGWEVCFFVRHNFELISFKTIIKEYPFTRAIKKGDKHRCLPPIYIYRYGKILEVTEVIIIKWNEFATAYRSVTNRFTLSVLV